LRYLKFLFIMSCAVLFASTCTKDLVGPDPDNNTGTVTDIDGNVYTTVKIGNQVWTVENLRTTKYNDGSAIPLVTDIFSWANLTTPSYCYYNNTTNADSIKKYGSLYNWYTVDTKKLAPAGWHVPTDVEWTILENYLIANRYNWDGTTDSNKIAKSLAAKTDWGISTTPGAIGNDLTKNNSSGFSALPCGYRGDNGDFNDFGSGGRWWGATESDASCAYPRALLYAYGYLLRYYFVIFKRCGFSVRLVRD